MEEDIEKYKQLKKNKKKKVKMKLENRRKI